MRSYAEKRVIECRPVFASYGFEVKKIRNADLYHVNRIGHKITEKTPCFSLLGLLDEADRLQAKRDHERENNHERATCI